MRFPFWPPLSWAQSVLCEPGWDAGSVEGRHTGRAPVSGTSVGAEGLLRCNHRLAPREPLPPLLCRLSKRLS